MGSRPTSRLQIPSSRWILYGRYEPTARARTLIKNREYRYVSAAFAKEYPDRKTGEPQGLTLTSVALTNQPFLDELPEVWLSVVSPMSDVRSPMSGAESSKRSRTPDSDFEPRTDFNPPLGGTRRRNANVELEVLRRRHA